MKMLYGLIRNEMIKVFARKKLWSFLIIQFLLGLVPLVIRVSTNDGQSYPLFLHGLTISWIVPIYIAILVADMFADEFANGTLALSLVHPVTRGELLLAKTLSLFVLIVMILLATMGMGYALGTATMGWGPQFLDRGIAYSSARGVFLTISTYLCSAIPLFVFGLFVMLLAFLLNGSGAVVGVSIGVILLFTALGYLDSDLAPYLFTNYFSSFPRALLFTKNYREVHVALMVMAVWAACSYVFSFVVFRNKDLVN